MRIRKMMRSIILAASIIAFAAFVPACATLGLTSHTQQIEATCASVGSALQVLSVAKANGQLNAAAIASVDSAVSVTEPVCSAKTVPTLSDAESATFSAAASTLANLAASYGSKNR